MTLSALSALSIFAVAACMVANPQVAGAAVRSSATIAVSATVLPVCGERDCAADGVHTEHLLVVGADTRDDFANPAPASARVDRMMVISY